MDKLQRGYDLGSKVFQGIAQRSFSRLRTTQGTYIVSPGGVLIDSGNVIAPENMKSFLENGLKEFKALPVKDKLVVDFTSTKSNGTNPKSAPILSGIEILRAE